MTPESRSLVDLGYRGNSGARQVTPSGEPRREAATAERSSGPGAMKRGHPDGRSLGVLQQELMPAEEAQASRFRIPRCPPASHEDRHKCAVSMQRIRDGPPCVDEVDRRMQRPRDVGSDIRTCRDLATRVTFM